MMKNIFLFLVILCIFNESEAQKRIKYKDVYDLILTGDKDAAYTQLLAYQKQDPHFANTYFQLALIAQDRAHKYDPLTRMDMTEFFIYNTKLYWGLAKLKMQDEKGRNRELYENAPIRAQKKKVQPEDIVLFIDSNLVEIKKYEENVVKIAGNFNKSVEFYNKCIVIFKKINTKYTKIKDIYLDADPELKKELDELKKNADSSKIYFQKYTKAITDYPILDYRQKFTLQTISTYRLDGLTNTCFLENNFDIWDYSSWVDDVFKTKNTFISTNTKEIVENNKVVTTRFRQIDDGSFVQEMPEFRVDEKFFYKIEKFDNASLLSDLFKLYENLINYRTATKSTLLDYNNKQHVFLKRARLLPEIIRKKQRTDSVLEVFEKKIQAEEIRKYADFYQTHYSGLTGIKEFAFRQKINSKMYLEQSFELFSKIINNELKFNLPDSLKCSDNTLFKTIKHTQDNSENPQTNVGFLTNAFPSSSSLIGYGFYSDSQLKKHSFIVSIDSSRTIIKPKKLHSGKFGEMTVIGGSTYTSGYIFLVIDDKNQKGVVLTDKNFSETKSFILTSSLFPRTIKYDDINDIVYCVFGGNEEINYDNVQFIAFNGTDFSVLFNTEITMKGRIFDFTKMDKQIFVFANYSSLEANGQKISSKASAEAIPSGICLLILDENGKIADIKDFSNEKPASGIKISKLNSGTISVFGIKSPENYIKTFLNEKNIFYMLIDSKAQAMYTHWHD